MAFSVLGPCIRCLNGQCWHLIVVEELDKRKRRTIGRTVTSERTGPHWEPADVVFEGDSTCIGCLYVAAEVPWQFIHPDERERTAHP